MKNKLFKALLAVLLVVGMLVLASCGFVKATQTVTNTESGINAGPAAPKKKS